MTIIASQQGYAFAQVKPRFDRDQINHRINITWVIDEGPHVYIERINIVGNFRTHDDVIRREFSLAEGDAYNKLLVEAAKRRLKSLGFFKTVDVDTEPGSTPDRVNLIVKVQEQPTGELSFGAGYSTSEGVIGDISVTERNLMGKGQYVRLGFSGSLERAQVDFSFTEPHFLDRNLAAGTDLFYKVVDFQYNNISSYSQSDVGGDLRLGFPIAYNTQLGLRYKFDREDIYDVAANASLAVKQSEGIANVSSVGFTVAYDSRNLPQSPTSGIFTSFSEDFAGVGGDVDYFRSVVDSRGYYPLTPKITLVGRVQGGFIDGWGGQEVRLQDLFFKGGETIRGFQVAGYGPRDACLSPVNGALVGNCQRDPLGGEAFWAATAEARFPLPFVPDNLGMSGAVFVDAGSLWMPSGRAVSAVAQEGSFINGTDELVRMSTGVSLIWQSPVGTAPRRSRAGPAQSLLRQNRTIPLWRFVRLLGACFCRPLGVIS